MKARVEKVPMKDRWRQFVRTYGAVGLVVHSVIAVLTWLGFWLAVRAGFVVDDAGSTAAAVGAAWVAMKAVSPIRWMVTVAVTPGVVLIWKKIYGHAPLTGDPALAVAGDDIQPSDLP